MEQIYTQMYVHITACAYKIYSPIVLNWKKEDYGHDDDKEEEEEGMNSLFTPGYRTTSNQSKWTKLSFLQYVWIT